jgi:hypothetical protein
MKELTKESLEAAIGVLKGTASASEFVVPSTAAGTITMRTTGRYNTELLKVHGRPVEIKPFEVDATMEMLEDSSSPYNIDPETLANLWVVRFGKGWVGNEAVDDLEDDVDWWRHAANRLRELGYLEMHTLASSYSVVLRIVE